MTISSGSGATLRGWFIAGQPGAGAVILMHGIRTNRLSMVLRARLLGEAGFSVLLFDFQAHGESTGSRITFGYLESRDASAAVAFIRDRLPAERIGVIGCSLGGAAAVLGAKPLQVDALVLESVYPDIGTAIANLISMVLGQSLGSVVSRPLSKVFELVLGPILNLSPADLRPIDHMGNITAPVLVVSGTQDIRTRVAETRAMFDRLTAPKRLWLVEGAGHIDLEAFAPDDYRNHVLRFFVESLRPGR